MGKPIPAQNNYFVSDVKPMAVTGLMLSAGKYCLGVDSTIPFVNFVGGGNVNKVFSWGEMIEVPEGQSVKVKNASFMAGDISINVGHDYAAKPERISTPLTLVQTDLDLFGLTTFKTIFPADTRRCRRAYLKFQLATNEQTVLLNVVGRAKKHSFPSTYTSIITGLTPFSYISSFTVGPASIGTTIPLGYDLGNATLELPMA